MAQGTYNSGEVKKAETNYPAKIRYYTSDNCSLLNYTSTTVLEFITVHRQLTIQTSTITALGQLDVFTVTRDAT